MNVIIFHQPKRTSKKNIKPPARFQAKGGSPGAGCEVSHYTVLHMPRHRANSHAFMLQFQNLALKYKECLSWISQLGDGFNNSQTGSFPHVGIKTKN